MPQLTAQTSLTPAVRVQSRATLERRRALVYGAACTVLCAACWSAPAWQWIDYAMGAL